MKKFYSTNIFKTIVALLVMNFIADSVAAQKICVIADIHYFDPDLLINDGTAFQTYLASDRKLLQESEAILTSVVDTIISIDPDIVIVAGDLTKDGEKTGHQKVAMFFDTLETAGIQVIVTPGNHDINNPDAESFDGDTTYEVESITAEEFKSIYADYGFNQAVASDTASLSFVYNVDDDLTIISMDVCDYEDNETEGSPVTGGRFREHQTDWVLDRIAEARDEGRVVMGVMHHGILEHYTGQKTLFSEYVVDDYDSVSTLFADAGMNIVFTGHYHAQDIAVKNTDSSFIFDIETGSTVTYPCPYRVLDLSDSYYLTVAGDSIQKIDYDLDTTFQAYALDFIETGLPVLVKYMLTSSPFYLSDSAAAVIEPAITESFIAHYRGDEGTPSAYTQAVITNLLSDANYATVGYILQQMWNDSQADWDMEVQLSVKSVETGINTGLINDPVSLYPNPTTGSFTVSGNFDENTKLYVYNIKGELVYSASLPDNEMLIEPDLDEGLYVVKISDGIVNLKRTLVVSK